MAHFILNRLLLIAALALAICQSPTLADVAPGPSNDAASEAYRLRVNGEPVFVVRFSNDYDYALASGRAGRNTIDIDRVDQKPIGQASVSPKKLGIAVTKAGSRLTFLVDGMHYLIVEVEGLRRLVIAIDPPDASRPDPDAPGVQHVTRPPFNADPTGQTFSTAAIQSAIDQAAADPSGKGLVYVPAGIFRLTQLRLASNVSLYLEKGAILRCDGRAEEFDRTFRKKSTGHDGFWFITASGVQNVRVFGRGTIDGRGKAMVKQTKLVNHLLTVVNCRNVTIEGITLRDSGLWGTVIGNSENVSLSNTKHLNFLDIGEDDCVDICNSRNVTVEHAIGISLDDPFSVKTWEPTTDVASNWPGEFGESSHVTFSNCFAWTRCFGFKIGAGVLRPQRDIRVTDSVVYDAAHAIGISHSYGSADVTDVMFERIDVERITCECLGRSWLRIAIDNRRKASTAGSVRRVTVQDILVRDPGTKPSPVEGLNADRRVAEVFFSRIAMPGESANELADLGLRLNAYSETVTLQNTSAVKD